MLLYVIINHTLGVLLHLMVMAYGEPDRDYGNRLIGERNDLIQCYSRIGLSLGGLVGVLIAIFSYIYRVGKKTLNEINEKERELEETIKSNKIKNRPKSPDLETVWT